MRLFQDFIDDLEGATDENRLRAVMGRVAEAMQLPVFAYLGLGEGSPGTKKPVVFGSYSPRWVGHYVDVRYDRIDPVLVSANTGLLPFQWGGQAYIDALSRDQQQIFSESRQFGIRQGFTIPIHDKLGQVATLNFATDENFRLFEMNVRENGPTLHLMAIYFHAYVRRHLQGIALPGRPSLSPREVQCLQWFARGKDSYAISELLGISRRTVIFHFQNAKARLGVVTLQQAVVEAMTRGLIAR
jgi:LuxR family transcriptional activator of conjugal transfer of Ti plasmids